LPSIPEKHDVKPPSMIIIGEVVSLHEKLAWFESTNSVSQ
jgi:siroheme synthase